MRHLPNAVLALLAVLPAALLGQATIPVSGAKVKDNSLNPVTGQLVFTVTDASNNVVTYTEQGGSPSTAPFVVQVVAGVVQSAGGYPPQIANPATMTPANTRYRMQVESAGGTTTYFTFPLVNITQSFFSYDGYSVPAGVTAAGAGVPHIPCSPQAQYSNTLASDPYPWVCSQFQGDSSVYWTQNPSLNPSCQRGNNQAVAATLTGTTFCVDAAQAFVTPGFVWAGPAAGANPAPVGLVPIANICGAGGCGGGNPAGPLHALQVNGPAGGSAGSFGGSTFLTDATNSDLLGVGNVISRYTNGRSNTDQYAIAGAGGPGYAINTVCTFGPCLLDIPAASTDTTPNIFDEPTAVPFLIEDHRNTAGAAEIRYFVNAAKPNGNGFIAPVADYLACLWTTDGLSNPGTRACSQRFLVTGGSGMNANNTWQVDHIQNDVMSVNNAGIKQPYALVFNSYSAGDRAFAYWYMNFRDATWTGSDQGVQGIGLQMTQFPPSLGTLTSAGGTGNTTLVTNMTNLGQSFTVVNENDVFSTGTLTGCSPAGTGGSPLPFCTTSDTHAASSWTATLSASCGAFVVPNAPVTAKCSVSGAAGTFNPAKKVCVGDYQGFEESQIALDTDGVSYDIGLTRLHAAGVPLAQGGACGSVLVVGNGQPTLAAVKANGFYTSYPIVSSTATRITYLIVFKEGQNGNIALVYPGVVPQVNSYVTRDGSGHGTLLVANAGAGSPIPPQTGYWIWSVYTAPAAAQITLSGCSDGSFNQTIASTTADEKGIYFPLSGAAGSASGCTLNVNGLDNYWAVGGTITTGMPNTTTDAYGNQNAHGTMQVMPNDLAWSPGDPLIQANAYASTPNLSYEILNSETPPIAGPNPAKLVIYGGQSSSGGSFFELDGGQPASAYYGFGGTIVPHTLIFSNDVIGDAFSFLNPVNGGSVFSLGCRSCAANENGFDLFTLGGHVGSALHWEPGTGILSVPYIFQSGQLTSKQFNLLDSRTGSNSVASPSYLYNFGNNPFVSWGITPGDDAMTTASGAHYAATMYAGAAAPSATTNVGVFFPGGGSTTWTYAVSAYTTSSTNETLPYTVTVANQPSGFSSTVFGQLQPNPVAGGQGFNVYRTSGASQGLICSIPNSAVNCVESGQAANAARMPPTKDTSGSLYVGGPINVQGTLGFTGSCASTTTLTVKNGIITGCS